MKLAGWLNLTEFDFGIQDLKRYHLRYKLFTNNIITFQRKSNPLFFFVGYEFISYQFN